MSFPVMVVFFLVLDFVIIYGLHLKIMMTKCMNDFPFGLQNYFMFFETKSKYFGGYFYP